MTTPGTEEGSVSAAKPVRTAKTISTPLHPGPSEKRNSSKNSGTELGHRTPVDSPVSSVLPHVKAKGI